MKQYKVVNGTSFDANTNDQVIDVLSRCMNDRTRIRVHYGDVATGLEGDTPPYVGECTDVLDKCVVKISTSLSNCVLYQHPNYHTSNN